MVIVMAIALAATVALWSNVGYARGEAYGVGVDPGLRVISSGETTTVMVELTGNDPIQGFDFRLMYNDGPIDVLSVEPAGAFAATPDFTSTQTGAGEWFFGAALLGGGTAPGTGDLAEITVQGQAAGTSDLDLFQVNVLKADNTGEQVPSAGVEGEIQVTGGGGGNGDPAVWVEPANSTAPVGASVFIDVMKDTDEALGAFDFFLVFDPAVIEFIDGSAGVRFTPKGAGVIQVTDYTTNPPLVPAGEQSLVEIEFQAKAIGNSPVDVIDAAEAAADPDLEPITLADTNYDELPDPTVTDGTVDVTDQPVTPAAFEFDQIADQVAGVPFGITIRAVTGAGQPTNYSGTANLSDSTGTIAPTTADFTNGTATLDVTITDAHQDVIISALDGAITGDSNAFDVVANVLADLTLVADPTVLPVGDTSTLSATVTDDFGNPLGAGIDVVFETDFGVLGSQIVTKTTDADGQATATLTSDAAGDAQVSATAGAATDDVTVTFETPEPDILVSPGALVASLRPGETISKVLTIMNTGDAQLDWTLSEEGAGVDWLVEDPTSGPVSPGDSTQVSVGFDATGLTPDVYTTTLIINSNDPDEDPVLVPVTLTVLEELQPDITVDPAVLTATLKAGDTTAKTLTIGNVGDVDLTWTLAEEGLGVPWLSEDPISGMVGPGGGDDVTVEFDADGLDPDVYETTLVITSNDPDESPLSVDVTLTVEEVETYRIFLPIVTRNYAASP